MDERDGIYREDDSAHPREGSGTVYDREAFDACEGEIIAGCERIDRLYDGIAFLASSCPLDGVMDAAVIVEEGDAWIGDRVDEEKHGNRKKIYGVYEKSFLFKISFRRHQFLL